MKVDEVAPRRVRAEGGQVLPMVALVVLVAAGAAMLIGRLGVEVVDRARARTAADAAALAGVTGGQRAAEVAAAANGGRLVRFSTVGGASQVTAQVGDEQATSRAAPDDDRAPRSDVGTGSSSAESQVDQAGRARYGPWLHAGL